MGRIIEFIRREKIYFFLLIFVILISMTFSFFGRFLEDSGLGKLFEEERFVGEEILPPEEIQEAIISNPIVYLVFIFFFLVFIFFAIAGLVLDVVYLYLNHRGEPLIDRTQSLVAVKWNFWDICKVAIIFLFAQRLILIADIFLFSTLPYLSDKDSLRLMLSATVVDIIAIAALFHFVLNEKRQAVTSLGLTAKRLFTNIRYGIFAYIGLIPILALVMYLTTIVFKMFDIPIEPQYVLLMFKEETHVPSLIYMGIFTAFLSPFLEEIFFRGFAYGVFKKRLGISWGIVASAIFFAYIHTNPASFFPIFCLGILLAYLYEKSGSLVPSIIVHIIHNSLSLFFLLFIKAITG